ncbi:MAG: GGDEF domain-containing protein, partial [Pseudomonadota bacterium]
LMRASITAVIMLATTSVVRFLIEPLDVHISTELYNLGMAAVMLPSAIFVSGQVSRLYRRKVKQREALSKTLTQLNELSTRDTLTGLTNRRQMTVLLEQEHKRQGRLSHAFCVAILDIDWFKRINDRHGHGVGDVVLQQFSHLANSALTPADTLARWGGEEFLLLMPGATQAQALLILDRIRDAIAQHPWASHAPELRVSFSAGVAEYAPPEPAAKTLDRADQALYRAKSEGRDRVVADRPPADAYLAHACQRAADAALSPDTQQPLTARATTVPECQCRDKAGHAVLQATTSAVTLPPINPTEPQPRRPLQRLGDLVLGSDEVMRERLRLPMFAMALYALWTGMIYWYAIPSGQMNAQVGRFVITYTLSAMLMFYPLIRSGWTAHLPDAGLSLVQIIVACGACAFGYAIAPDLRASLLHLMCVIQVFGMVSLRPKASRIAGASAVLLLIVAFTALLWLAPPHFEPKLEALKISLSCFILARLSMLGHDFSKVREKVATERLELAQAVEQVNELVIRDSLTGLFNRKYMQDLLDQERQRHDRTGHPYCVALIDLDHFKRINDTHGHQAGDDVLMGFASAAQAALRETDVICRWGGEEFLVLLRDTDPGLQGREALNRLRDNLTNLRTPADVAVTFSCGLALALPDEVPERTIERADRALYAAKTAGRNRDITAPV